ncbi:MAG TPA: sugar ABC transporter ATP-binding protein [Planctomycetaceae bacterium]|nr:sugar ABC transporter ATP-binding protein [Planctomycetaceae bacterium]
MSSPALLTAEQITVRFGGVPALENVHFDLAPGEVHGLVGCNGAGKSTLMKVLAGAVPHYEGAIQLDGQPVKLSSPRVALSHGIAMVYQEMSGIGQLSVAENLFLGRQPLTRWGTVDWKTMRQRATEELAQLDVHVDVRRPLRENPLVVRQLVEIARGLNSGAKILILDEPTSALSPPEAQRLFSVMRRLRDRGVAQIFITHFLEDVLAICDRVTVLRDGQNVSAGATASFTRKSMLDQMVGRQADAAGQETVEAMLPPASEKPVRLATKKLTHAAVFEDVSLTVRAGECLGLYGFVGAGHQELVQALAGAAPVDSGTIVVDERPLPTENVTTAVSRGVVFVAADRGRTVTRRAPIAHNVTLAHLKRTMGNWLTRPREDAVARPVLERVGCRPPDPRKLAGLLSGGNQQKVVFAKWLLGPIKVLLLEEPTRGMDVHAKSEVMQLVKEQQAAGVAVILASTEPELLLAYADRIITFRRGRMHKEFAGEKVTKHDLMHAAE